MVWVWDFNFPPLASLPSSSLLHNNAAHNTTLTLVIGGGTLAKWSFLRFNMGKTKAAEKAKLGENKLSVKRKVSERVSKRPSKKAEKDPNKPKRPPSAFFVFMEEFRISFKEKNPNNKSVAVVGKAGGDKWKTLSEAEKAPYIAKAEKRKVEYNKTMAAYNKKKAAGESTAADEEEEEASDKSKSEVDEESGEEDDEDDDE